MLITVTEFAKKHGVDRSYVSAAIREAMLPVDDVKLVERRMAPQYEEKAIAGAMITMYNRRRDNMLERAKRWQELADAIGRLNV